METTETEQLELTIESLQAELTKTKDALRRSEGNNENQAVRIKQLTDRVNEVLREDTDLRCELGNIKATLADVSKRQSEGDDLLYVAWSVIANVSEGDWDRQSKDWEEAARRWRDRWHLHLNGATATVCGKEVGDAGFCSEFAGHEGVCIPVDAESLPPETKVQSPFHLLEHEPTRRIEIKPGTLRVVDDGAVKATIPEKDYYKMLEERDMLQTALLELGIMVGVQAHELRNR